MNVSFKKVLFDAKKYFFSYNSVPFQTFSIPTLICIWNMFSQRERERAESGEWQYLSVVCQYNFERLFLLLSLAIFIIVSMSFPYTYSYTRIYLFSLLLLFYSYCFYFCCGCSCTCCCYVNISVNLWNCFFLNLLALLLLLLYFLFFFFYLKEIESFSIYCLSLSALFFYTLYSSLSLSHSVCIYMK